MFNFISDNFEVGRLSKGNLQPTSLPAHQSTSLPGHLLTFTPQKFLLDFPRVTSHMDGKDRGKKWPACRPVEGRKRKKERKKEKKKEGEGETRLKWYLAYRIMSLI